MNKILSCFSVVLVCAVAAPHFGLQDDYYDESPPSAIILPFSTGFWPSIRMPDIWSSIKYTFGLMDDIEKKGNTTSDVKVINGTVITTNETNYFDEKTGSIVHLKTIDIRPSEETPVSGTTTKPPPKTEAESTEDPNNQVDVDNVEVNGNVDDNEIPKENTHSTEKVTQNKSERDVSAQDNNMNMIPHGSDWENEVEVFHNPSLNNVDSEDFPVVDIQNDILVNGIRDKEIMEGGGMFALDPDVELFDPSHHDVNNVLDNTQIKHQGFDDTDYIDIL